MCIALSVHLDSLDAIPGRPSLRTRGCRVQSATHVADPVVLLLKEDIVGVTLLGRGSRELLASVDGALVALLHVILRLAARGRQSRQTVRSMSQEFQGTGYQVSEATLGPVPRRLRPCPDDMSSLDHTR